MFFVSFHRKKKEKTYGLRKKTRHIERSSCHFFFKESTFLERAPGASHPLRSPHLARRAPFLKKEENVVAFAHVYCVMFLIERGFASCRIRVRLSLEHVVSYSRDTPVVQANGFDLHPSNNFSKDRIKDCISIDRRGGALMPALLPAVQLV